MEELKLRITYNAKDINGKLDSDLDKVLKSHKYKFIGSGYNFKSQVRDITYERGKHENT